MLSPVEWSLIIDKMIDCRSDGWLEAWDIIYKQSSPAVVKQVSSGPLHCLSLNEFGSHMCVGQSYSSFAASLVIVILIVILILVLILVIILILIPF